MNFIRKLLGLSGPKAPVRTSRDRDFDLRGLERLLHYEFKTPALARQAMTHRSYLHATPGRSGESNERMEFLGDSVVGLVVNEFLYKKFTKLREGELTKMKSLLVSRVILSRAANQLGLGHYVLLSDAEKGSGGRSRASILADTLEGIIGAMYLDGGIEPARKLTERLLLREVNTILSDANLANYKSMLQEYVQGEFKTHPQYRISSEYGPDHQKMFTVEVVVSGKTFGRGHGSNKKEAEQEAARDALFHFEKLVSPEAPKATDEPEGDHRRRRRGGRGRRNGRGREGRGEGAPQHGRGEGREGGAPEHVRGEGGGEDMPRHGREESATRHGREERAPRHGREEREPRHGREEREPRHGREERAPRHGREESAPRHGREESAPRHGREESAPGQPAAHESAPGGEISYGRRERRDRRQRGRTGAEGREAVTDSSKDRQPRDAGQVLESGEPRREREPSREPSYDRERHEPREYEAPRSEEAPDYEPPRERDQPREEHEPRPRETRDVEPDHERATGREPGEHGEDEGRRGPYAASRLHAEP